MRIIKVLLVLLFFLINCSRGIELNIIAFTIEDTGYCFNTCIEEFNKYSKENNLDIIVKMNLLTSTNFSVSLENSNMMYESILKRKKDSYDLFFYDASWTHQYCPYFIDLNKHLDKDHINMYNETIVSQLGRCQDKIIGLPLTLGYEALYSNKELLKKYNKDVPKTWQQLLDTGKEILTKERALNNTELIGYNGLLFDTETGFCSVYEYFYSCRKSYDSPFPDLTSQEMLDAALLLKKIKNELSSDEIYSSGLDYTFQKLFDGNAIFLKFYVYSLELMRYDSPFEMTNIPGIREGLTGTILSGYNIGISNNIDEDRLSSAIEVIKFMTSKATQKKLVLQNQIVSAITSIYEEEDVCANIKNCKMFRDPQPIAKPVDLTNNFNEYSSRFTNYFYDFLYRNEDPSKMLKAMVDLSKIYDVNINSKETYLGLITVILFSIFILLMIFSLLFLHIERFNKCYTFLSNFSWYLIIFGIICILSSGYTKFGMVTNFKCHLHNVLISLGYSLIYVPVLSILLINIPEENKITKWIKKSKSKFILMLITFNMILNGLSFIDKYNIVNIILNEGENFQKCKMNRIFIIAIYILLIIYYIVIILVLLLLIFAEWNLQKIKNDIRFVLSSIYMNIITFVMLFIFNFLEINNYLLYFGLYELLLFIISVVNYLTLYGIRILLPGMMSKDNELEIINKIRVNESTYEKSDNTTISSILATTISKSSEQSKTLSKFNTIYTKVLEYHYIK